MNIASGATVSGIIVLVVLLVCAPLVIYHFLIFPNIDGVAQDLSFYNYDVDSSHFLYWFFFWGVGGIGLASAARLSSKG